MNIASIVAIMGFILTLGVFMVLVVVALYWFVRTQQLQIQLLASSLALSAVKDDAEERRGLKKDDWDKDDEKPLTAARPSLLAYTPDELIEAAFAVEDAKNRNTTEKPARQREYNAADNANEDQTFDAVGASNGQR